MEPLSRYRNDWTILAPDKNWSADQFSEGTTAPKVASTNLIWFLDAAGRSQQFGPKKPTGLLTTSYGTTVQILKV